MSFLATKRLPQLGQSDRKEKYSEAFFLFHLCEQDKHFMAKSNYFKTNKKFSSMLSVHYRSNQQSNIYIVHAHYLVPILNKNTPKHGVLNDLVGFDCAIN